MTDNPDYASAAPNVWFTVNGTGQDIAAALAAGFKFEPHTQSASQLAERLIYAADDKIDLARGFRILMEVAASYCSFDMVDAILSGPPDKPLSYDEAIRADARYDGCNDPRVIIHELMKMFGDECIRDLVNERIEAARTGATVTLAELNARAKKNPAEG